MGSNLPGSAFNRVNNQRESGLRWHATDYATALSQMDARELRSISFAASAESSTQHAYDVFLKQLNASQDVALREGRRDTVEVLENVSAWLRGWVLEEKNHVEFFDIAHAHLLSQGEIKVASERDVFGVEAPIPEAQDWMRTLMFLLYSEIASMVWYRCWYKKAGSAGLKAALLQIHQDETRHYMEFLRTACALAELEPRLVGVARSVLASFSWTFRKIVHQARNQAGRTGRERLGLNWWEHPIFAQVDEVEMVFQRIRLIQKFSFSCIQRATEQRCLRTA